MDNTKLEDAIQDYNYLMTDFRYAVAELEGLKLINVELKEQISSLQESLQLIDETIDDYRHLFQDDCRFLSVLIVIKNIISKEGL